MEDLNRIRVMLDRFYEGESSVDEERELQHFFRGSELPEEWRAEKDIFDALKESKEAIPVPDDLNRKILQRLDAQIRKDARRRRISLYSLSGIAAGLLALITIYQFVLRDVKPESLAQNSLKESFDDPMEAYEEARRTLAYMSAKLSNGTRELEHIQKAGQATMEPLQSLSMLRKGNREIGFLENLSKLNNTE